MTSATQMDLTLGFLTPDCAEASNLKFHSDAMVCFLSLKETHTPEFRVHSQLTGS